MIKTYEKISIVTKFNEQCVRIMIDKFQIKLTIATHTHIRARQKCLKEILNIMITFQNRRRNLDKEA